MSVDFDRSTSLYAGSLSSPPYAPSMSRNSPQAEDASHIYDGLLGFADDPVHHQSYDNAFSSSRILSRGSEQCSSGAYIHDGYELALDESIQLFRQSSSTSILSANQGERGTQLLSPDSLLGFPECNQLLVNEASLGTYPGPLRTAESESTIVESQSDEEDEDTSTVSNASDEGSRIEKTAAQSLADKRKMKRFRLTHAQTRYLMSEFARQAHPDAGQRRRLSRDIPGLSPRQVQVWFQNRRAKLKRLTTEDQERMMTSRALPTDFDFSQSLRHGLGGEHQPPTHKVPNIGMNVRNESDTLILPSCDGGRLYSPPFNTASTYSGLPGGQPAEGLLSLSPGASTNSGSRYPYQPRSELGASLRMETHLISPYGQLDYMSLGPHTQANTQESKSNDVDQVFTESLISPTTQSDMHSIGNLEPGGLGSFGAQPLFDDIALGAEAQPLAPRTHTQPAQYSRYNEPATASVGHSFRPTLHSRDVKVDVWQSGGPRRPEQ